MAHVPYLDTQTTRRATGHIYQKCDGARIYITEIFGNFENHCETLCGRLFRGVYAFDQSPVVWKKLISTGNHPSGRYVDLERSWETVFGQITYIYIYIYMNKRAPRPPLGGRGARGRGRIFGAQPISLLWKNSPLDIKLVYSSASSKTINCWLYLTTYIYIYIYLHIFQFAGAKKNKRPAE